MEMKFSTTTVFLIYLAVVNVAAALLCGLDKTFARNHAQRISENTLFLISLIGGSFAMYLAMRILHHKTHHKSFMIGLPLIMIAQIALLYWIHQNPYYFRF